MLQSSSPAVFAVNVSRRIDASADVLYRAWTDPEQFPLWMGCTSHRMHPAVGDLYFLEMDHEGRKWAHYGRYLRLEKGRVVEFTWMSEATDGLDTVVTVELTPHKEGGTQLSLGHRGLPDTKRGRDHQEGWTALLEEIAKRYGGKKS
jgi:uncharacterized protein YndB with AHSA1/START domain